MGLVVTIIWLSLLLYLKILKMLKMYIMVWNDNNVAEPSLVFKNVKNVENIYHGLKDNETLMSSSWSGLSHALSFNAFDTSKHYNRSYLFFSSIQN